jgi:nitrogen regulatory protein PII
VQINRNGKLITCILPAGIADEVVRRLESEVGIIEAGVSKARGMGHLTPRRYGAGVETEKEILTVVVPESQADDLFRFLFDAARIDRPHGGIMFMNPLIQATRFELPKIGE